MIINLRNIPIVVAKGTCLIEHCDEVDMPLVDLCVGGAGDEGGVVVHRHRGLQVAQDPRGVRHHHGTHHHGRNLKKSRAMLENRFWENNSDATSCLQASGLEFCMESIGSKSKPPFQYHLHMAHQFTVSQ